MLTYWMATGTRMVGASRLRPELDDALRKWGGHIAYDVRPSERGKGIGTLLLRLTLNVAKRHGLSTVSLMCYASNAPSIRVIEHNGGKFIAEGKHDGQRFLHYSISS